MCNPLSSTLSVSPISSFKLILPQQTKQTRLKSKIKVPLLAGKYVPRYPGHEPANNLISTSNNAELQSQQQSQHAKWQKEFDDFGSYFLTLLAPWNLQTGVPDYPLNGTGLISWIRQEAIETSIERSLAVNDKVHQGRLRYLDNCVFASQKSKYSERLTAMFRDQSADSKEQYLCRQAQGDRHGHAVCGEGDDTAYRRASAPEIAHQIDDIRGFVEGLEGPQRSEQHQELLIY